MYAFISTAVMYTNYGHACMYAVLASTKHTFMYTKKKCKQIFNFSRLGESAPSIRFDCFISNAMRGAFLKKAILCKGIDSDTN